MTFISECANHFMKFTSVNLYVWSTVFSKFIALKNKVPLQYPQTPWFGIDGISTGDFHIHTHIPMHAYMHVHTHKQTHTHTRMRTHTHKHTH